MGTLALLYLFLQRSYRDGRILERLTVWEERAELVRHNPRGPEQRWSANLHWVTVHLHPTGGPVQNYVTLRGAGREVEIGAFLTPEEREDLYTRLRTNIRR
jgi:uncharacterized membrane protein